MFDKIKEINTGFDNRFPQGKNPFKLITRLLEECGELAEQVNHFEETGVKVEKHGHPDRLKMGKELKDVLQCVLGIASYYDVYEELEKSINITHQRLTEEGYIK